MVRVMDKHIDPPFPRSLRLFGGNPNARAHPDRTPLTGPQGLASSGQDAPNFRPEFRLRDVLADMCGALALLAMIYGMLLFPEVSS